MAHPEFKPHPSGFQPEITYALSHLSPQVIAPATNFVFTTYRQGIDTSGGAKRILKDSLQFISNARNGLAKYPETLDRMRLVSVEDLLAVKSVDGPAEVPDDEAREALDFSLITMGIMPEESVVYVSDLQGKPQEFPFSKRGTLRVPGTLMEAAGRLRELRAQTLAVAMNTAPHAIHVTQNQELLRTVLFWEMGAKLAKNLRTV